MAEISSYSIEERLMASVRLRERQHTGQTVCQVMAASWEWFNKAPPRRVILLDWGKKERSLLEVLKTGHDRHVVFWSKENPSFTQELEHIHCM
jgi:hypothetical protein